jgi:hypothetical protein
VSRDGNDPVTPAQPASEPILAFCSYASKDETSQQQLRSAVAMLERQGLLRIWHFGELEPGVEWDAEIRRQLDESEIILLLVSRDFLASKYIWEKEVMRAMSRHDKRTARVIPILLKPCDWNHEPLEKLQALPQGLQPISQWKDPDEAWQNVVDGLRKVVTTLRGTQPRPSTSQPTAAELVRNSVRKPRPIFRVVFALVMLLALLIALWIWRSQSKPVVRTEIKPQQTQGRLIVDARPWAHIDSVTERDGHPLVTNAETPLNIPVPEGRYTIALRGPNNDLRTQDVYVRSDTPGRVVEEFPLPSRETYRAAVERRE